MPECELLAAINGARPDPQVSPSAMRWNPVLAEARDGIRGDEDRA